jgi:hypothetical protein
MVKELFQLTFSISSGSWAIPAFRSSRNHGNPDHGTFIAAVYNRLRQIMGLFRFQALTPIFPIALLVGIIVMSFPMRAPASEVTLAWNVNNQTPDGFLVFQRVEGQTYDYTNPAWPTDGRDHTQSACTIADLADGVKYYFVVRAYTGRDQSGDSNEVTHMAPAPFPVTIVNDNSPPEQPALMSIADGENGVSLMPLLRASDFDDPNSDDYHARTEWRILLVSGIRQIILDHTCDKGQLSEIQVPPLVLVPSTEYLVQVRFSDDRGMPSPWSQPVDFSTATDESDQNQNRIPDSQESIAAWDMNGDTISDLEQEFVVKSLVTYNDQHMISISVELNDPTVQIQAAASIDPATLTSSGETAPYAGDETPYGLLGYRINVDQPGEVITVKLNLSDPLDPGTTQWVRYDAVDGMSNCDTSTDIDDSGLIVYRYLVDGGDEDADGVANGVIVDLSGPRKAHAIDDSDDSSLAIPGGSSGGCFIRSLF